MVYNLIELVQLLSSLFTLLILIRVVISWVAADMRNPLVAFIHRVTEPVMAPVRNLLPATAGLDFSPLVVLILVQVLERIIVRLLLAMA